MTFKTTLAAAAFALSLVGLGATAGTAAAGPQADVVVRIGTPGVVATVPAYRPARHVHKGRHYRKAPRYRRVPARYRRPARVHRHRSCSPVYAKRSVFVRGYGWQRARVRVGRTCKTIWR
ncbi:hypothetical protein [Rhodobium gokarnense]|uniref:Uncharacterized protein n=1 Tax=Rhodobium gokarnense TaxID=364296 RepID=A0ABT3HDQ9_9HYPH|nr:hypothetical protein [Rhodobium gokarnense]MCW2308530.1 hypothetical protein [Rhodobium gokarnense]